MDANIYSIVTMASTVALTAVTGVYVKLTWAISKSSKLTSEASQRSAEAAKLAAESAKRSAIAAESQIPVHFNVGLTYEKDQPYFRILPSVNLAIRHVELDATIITDDDPTTRWNRIDAKGVVLEMAVHDRREQSDFVHGNEMASFLWPEAQMRRSDIGLFGLIHITYKLGDLGERTRSVFYETADGLARKFGGGDYPRHLDSGSSSADKADQFSLDSAPAPRHR